MSTRVCIPIHNRRPYRCSRSKLINRYRITWYLLCSSTLSLRFIKRSSICNHRRVCSMISNIHRTHNKPKLIKGPVCRYICRSKFNILSSTLLRISRNTTTIFWLSRCLNHMKHYLINRLNNLICKSNNIPIHYMRKNLIKPTNLIPYTYKKFGRMITKLPTSRTQILRTTNYLIN